MAAYFRQHKTETRSTHTLKHDADFLHVSESFVISIA